MKNLNKKYIAIVTLILILSCMISKPSYGVELGRDNKTVYLTFDDGPSPSTTNEILKVLENNNIKGSFFIIGKNARDNSDIIKNMNKSGMAVMPHTDSHEYNKIYSCAKSYFEDLKNCENTISALTGKENLRFVRMPGGSDNSVASESVLDEIRKNIISNNKYYIDWSLDTGDTETAQVTVDFIESRVREYGGLYKVEVVLMHDLQNKITTIESLQKTIDFYTERGYEFKTLDNINSEEIDYLKEIRVINKA
ncbi:MAG: polysaccharide deacetylase family protein [Clostridium sp.]